MAYEQEEDARAGFYGQRHAVGKGIRAKKGRVRGLGFRGWVGFRHEFHGFQLVSCQWPQHERLLPRP